MKATMCLDLAVSYTPPGSDMSMTLATVRDAVLLVAAVRVAIADADAGIKRATDPLAKRGLTMQRDYLILCLDQLVGADACNTSVVM
jgi:hypothetical protein